MTKMISWLLQFGAVVALVAAAVPQLERAKMEKQAPEKAVEALEVEKPSPEPILITMPLRPNEEPETLPEPELEEEPAQEPEKEPEEIVAVPVTIGTEPPPSHNPYRESVEEAKKRKPTYEEWLKAPELPGYLPAEAVVVDGKIELPNGFLPPPTDPPEISAEEALEMGPIFRLQAKLRAKREAKRARKNGEPTTTEGE